LRWAVALDAGVLGQVSHPRPNADVARRFRELLDSDTAVIIPEISDFEVRRELLRAKKTNGLTRLDRLKSTLWYLPLTTSIMLRAAELWASARQHGLPTADPKELDCDVILASQALSVGAAVVTDNVGHLGRFVEVLTWRS
jgi:predicted nucleic acid-binding protein